MHEKNMNCHQASCRHCNIVYQSAQFPVMGGLPSGQLQCPLSTSSSPYLYLVCRLASAHTILFHTVGECALPAQPWLGILLCSLLGLSWVLFWARCRTCSSLLACSSPLGLSIFTSSNYLYYTPYANYPICLEKPTAFKRQAIHWS